MIIHTSLQVKWIIYVWNKYPVLAKQMWNLLCLNNAAKYCGSQATISYLWNKSLSARPDGSRWNEMLTPSQIKIKLLIQRSSDGKLLTNQLSRNTSQSARLKRETTFSYIFHKILNYNRAKGWWAALRNKHLCINDHTCCINSLDPLELGKYVLYNTVHLSE